LEPGFKRKLLDQTRGDVIRGKGKNQIFPAQKAAEKKVFPRIGSLPTPREDAYKGGRLIGENVIFAKRSAGGLPPSMGPGKEKPVMKLEGEIYLEKGERNEGNIFFRGIRGVV